MRIDKAKYFFFSLSLMGSIIFFSINSLMNVQYEGAEQSNSYVYFSVFVFLVVSFITVLEFKQLKKRLCFIIPVLVSICFILEFPTAQNADQSFLMMQSFKYFWAFTVPCVLVGIIVGNIGGYIQLFKWVDAWAFVVALGCIVTLPRLLFNRIVQFGGGNYQLLSYVAAFVASILLYNILNNNHLRFSFLKKKIVSIISGLLIIGCIMCIFGSGGRGGFLLLMINAIILLYSRRRWLFKHFYVIILFAVFSILILSHINSDALSVIFDRGASRILETFFSSGDSLVSKSGRAEVYEIAIKMIKDNPFGYGFFRSYAIAGNYPHNIFLELIMDGGYLLLVLSVLFFIRLIVKYKVIIKDDSDLKFLALLFSYPMVMLLFTSTYLWSGLFWFCVSFLVSLKRNKCIRGNGSMTQEVKA